MQLLFARVASDGTILAGPSVIASAGALSFPRLAAWPGGFGLVWVDVTHDELHFRALGADGAFVGESILAREDVMVPDVTWIGDRYGVAWHDSAIAVVGVVAPDATDCPDADQPRRPRAPARDRRIDPGPGDGAAGRPFQGLFYLVAMTTPVGSQGIGNDSAGHPRHNAHPCP
jgi:hypothetical protein